MGLGFRLWGFGVRVWGVQFLGVISHVGRRVEDFEPGGFWGLGLLTTKGAGLVHPQVRTSAEPF